MDQMLRGVDRASLIRWTAIYLIVYAVINACGGILLGLAGGLATGVGIIAGESGAANSDAAAASTALTAVGGLSIALAIFYLVPVPVLGIAAWGLFQRKAWARMGAVIALALTIVLSLLTIGNGFTSIIWVIVSAIGIFIFWTDQGVKQELGG